MKQDRTPEITTVVLAAGSSRRFGSDKRLHLIDGKPMLQQVLVKPLSLEQPTLLVLKPEDQKQLASLVGEFQTNACLTIAYAPEAHQGMGETLAFAISQLETVEGAMIILGDTPWLKASTIKEILSAFKPRKIIRPVCENKKGHPVLFSSFWFKDLQKQQGDQGARRILTDNPQAIIEIEVNDDGIYRDLDEI